MHTCIYLTLLLFSELTSLPFLILNLLLYYFLSSLFTLHKPTYNFHLHLLSFIIHFQLKFSHYLYTTNSQSITYHTYTPTHPFSCFLLYILYITFTLILLISCTYHPTLSHTLHPATFLIIYIIKPIQLLLHQPHQATHFYLAPSFYTSSTLHLNIFL
jgi:hypothetical protein